MQIPVLPQFAGGFSCMAKLQVGDNESFLHVAQDKSPSTDISTGRSQGMSSDNFANLATLRTSELDEQPLKSNVAPSNAKATNFDLILNPLFLARCPNRILSNIEDTRNPKRGSSRFADKRTYVLAGRTRLTHPIPPPPAPSFLHSELETSPILGTRDYVVVLSRRARAYLNAGRPRRQTCYL